MFEGVRTMKIWLTCVLVLMCSMAFARDGLQVYIGNDEKPTEVEEASYDQYTVELFGSGAVCANWVPYDGSRDRKIIILRTDNLSIETKDGKRPRVTVEQGKHSCKFKLWITQQTDYGTVWIWLADGDTKGFDFVQTGSLDEVFSSVRSPLKASVVTRMIQQAYSLEVKAKK